MFVGVTGSDGGGAEAEEERKAGHLRAAPSGRPVSAGALVEHVHARVYSRGAYLVCLGRSERMRV
mgnify:CR=1 FL=1